MPRPEHQRAQPNTNREFAAIHLRALTFRTQNAKTKQQQEKVAI